MGMFDSVYATCPKCGKQVEFQSKAGECDLKKYSANNVPPAIALDLTGGIEACDCGFKLRLMPARQIERVTMIIEDGSKEWEWD